MPSLTRGDFDTIDNDESRATGRALFLLAIQENHRDVLAALAAQPLVAYKDVEPRLIQENWIEEDLAAHFICRDKDTFIDGDLSHFRDLYEALQQWAKYYDLWVDWMIAQALDTLRVWSLPVVELVGQDWAVWPSFRRFGLNMPEELRVFRFEREISYLPGLERFEGSKGEELKDYERDDQSKTSDERPLLRWKNRRRQLEKEVKAEFARRLKEHLDKVADWKREIELNPSKHGAAHPLKKDNDRDFDWLAKYQIGKMSYNNILNDFYDQGENISYDGVWSAIQRTAELVGIKLRQTPDIKSNEK